MMLSDLLRGFAELPPRRDVDVTGLTQDSRVVRAGEAFVALAGASTHGLRYAQAALDTGAAAILFEPPAPDSYPPPADAIAVPALRTHLGALAARYFDAPSQALDVIGVTGTNGKTSIVQLLAQALSLRAGVAGSIGTLGAGLYGALRAGERTTPDVIEVHRLIAKMRDAGARQVAMEVSSHALAQGRIAAVVLRVAAFTNLTRDHLDYHGDMQAYGAVKSGLFRWPGLRAAVINLDDAFGRSLHADVPSPVRRIGLSSRGEDGAALRADAVAQSASGFAFDLVAGQERRRVESPLLGRFNVDNLLAVGGVLLALDWPLREIADMLPRLDPVPGRMSRVGGAGGLPLVVVDYAHTPDALKQTLTSLRAHARGALLCVFGCGGERDRGKRPQMAAIAEALADRVIVTDDNPRGEDGDTIVADILAGLQRREAVRVERNRAAAIALAVVEARAGDVVLIAGKGHEAYQEIAGRKHPFDDLALARGALELRA